MNDKKLHHTAMGGVCIIHYGIEGQKWGIRKYQNPDGTLTEAGKKRYYKHGEAIASNLKKRTNRDFNKAVRLMYTKGPAGRQAAKKYAGKDKDWLRLVDTTKKMSDISDGLSAAHDVARVGATAVSYVLGGPISGSIALAGNAFLSLNETMQGKRRRLTESEFERLTGKKYVKPNKAKK